MIQFNSILHKMVQNNSEKIANRNDIWDYLKVAGILLAVLIWINGIIHSYKYHNTQDKGALDRWSTLPFLRGVEAVFHKH